MRVHQGLKRASWMEGKFQVSGIPNQIWRPLTVTPLTMAHNPAGREPSLIVGGNSAMRNLLTKAIVGSGLVLGALTANAQYRYQPDYRYQDRYYRDDQDRSRADPGR